MRKVLSVLLVLALVVSLAACGSVSGKYKMAKVTEAGVEITAGSEMWTQSFGDADNYIELSDNDAVTFSFANESQAGTYTVDGDSITITIEGEAANGTIDGDTITLEMEGITMVFEKE